MNWRPPAAGLETTFGSRQRTRRLYWLRAAVVLLFVALTPTANSTTELVVFGPKTYTRGPGTPSKVVTKFRADQFIGPFRLVVENHGVTSAIITLNGQTFLFPGDFKGNEKNGTILERDVTLTTGDNVLSVELRSNRGTSLTLTIFGAGLRNHPPVANAGPDQTVAVRQMVQLTGAASTDADGDPLTYSWSFESRPSGSSASLSNPTSVTPTLVPDLPGTYIVRLVVNDGTVESAPDTMTVSTFNSAPVANAGPDQTAPVGAPITLDGSGSTDIDGDPLVYSWSFQSAPAGSSVFLSDASAVHPSFIIDRPGSYVLQLVVNDGKADSAPDTVTITTTNSAPVANAGPDQSAPVTSTVTLDGSGSTDVDGDTLTYAWSLNSRPSGSGATLSDASAVRPTFVIDRPGTYVAQLIVRDSALASAPDTVTITTTNSAPVANAGPDQSAIAGRTVTLNGSGSLDVDGDVLTYQWSLTTVPMGSAATLVNPATASPSFVVDLPGTYIAQLIVNDGFVNSAPDTVTITTTNSAPVANAGPDQSGVAVGALVTLDGSASADPDGQVLAYSWALIARPPTSVATLDDATAQHPTFTPDVAGDYVAQLIVNDGFVNSAPDTVLIRTNANPIARAGPDQQVLIGSTVLLDGSASSDPEGSALTYRWSFTSTPVGSMAALLFATTATPTFVPDRAGTYIAELTVTDDLGATSVDSITVAATSPPVVTISPTDASASEMGSDPATFTVSRTGNLSGELLILYAISGSATNGTDYAALSGSVTIAAGQPSSIITVTPLDDVIVEGPESVVVTLSADAAYVVGVPDVAAITIADNDFPVNSPPVPNAGPDQTVALPSSAVLAGTVVDDGLPLGSLLSASWSLVSAPTTGGQTWLQTNPTGTLPYPVQGASSVDFDSNTNRLIVFGGRTGSPSNDVWVLSGANGLTSATAWTRLAPSGTGPGPRYSQSAIYDPATNRLIVFAGVGPSYPTTNNDVWILTNANGTGGTPEWLPLIPTGPLPVPRFGSSVAYDSATNTMMVFGGDIWDQSGQFYYPTNETWILTNANGTSAAAPTWTLLTPVGSEPDGRDSPFVAYDSGSNRLVAFGGGQQYTRTGTYVATVLNDTWVLVNANGSGGAARWIQLTQDGASGSPAQRWPGIGAYNAANNSLTIGLGVGNCSVSPASCTDFFDVWSLTNANGLGGSAVWTQLEPSGGPPSPMYRSAYDSENDRLIGFSGTTNSSWILTNAATSIGAVAFSNPTFSVPNVAGQAVSTSTNAVFSTAGTYVLRFTADDGQLTGTDDITLQVNTPTAPTLISISPNSATQGQQNLAITLTGQSTHFTAAVTQASFGAGIAVRSLTVVSQTRVEVLLSVDSSAAIGLRTITLVTGSETVTASNALLVNPGIPGPELLFVSNRATGTNDIVAFDASTGASRGVFIQAGSGGMSGPDGMAFGSDGSFYAVSNNFSTFTGQILRYDGQTGAFLNALVTDPQGTFTDFTFGPNGNLFVSFWENANSGAVVREGSVREYDRITGNFVRRFALVGDLNTACGCPQQLTFGPNGNLYVATEGDVVEFDGVTGAFVRGFGATDTDGVTFGPDNRLYVSTFGRGPNYTGGQIAKYDPSTGTLIGVVVPPGSGGLGYAHSLRFGLDGNLYAVDTTYGQVLRYSSNGTFIDAFVPAVGGGTGNGLQGPINLIFGHSAAAPQNHAPTVNAGPDQSVSLSNGAFLVGTATDDGLPPGSVLTYVWSQVSGPGITTFANATVASTSAMFSAVGTYTLRLTTNDSELTGSDDVLVTVNPIVNQPPVVNAGADQSVTLPPRPLPTNYTITFLPGLSDARSRAWDINDLGEAVGSSVADTRPVVWRNGAVVRLPTPTGTFGRAGAIGINGWIGGESGSQNFLFSGGAVVGFGFKACDCAMDINRFGDLVGLDTRGPMLYRNDQLTLLPLQPGGTSGHAISINDNGLIVGHVDTGTAQFPAQWQNGQLTVLPTFTGVGTSTTWAYDVNNLGEISGQLPDGMGNVRAVLWQNGLPVALGPFASSNEVAYSLNDRHEVLVASQMNSGAPVRAWVWKAGATVELTPFIAPHNTRFILTQINNRGQVVGYLGVNSNDPTDPRGFVLTPDPTTPQIVVALQGSASDDGLPGSSLQISWTKISGPGTVTFADGSNSTTTATFSEPGSYVLRLTASDSQFTSTDDITVNVSADPVDNEPPTVDSGADQTVDLATGASLHASASDDGLPAGGTLTYAWWKLDGPGSVTFTSQDQADTLATFSSPGVYTLRVVVNDGVLSNADDVTINVSGSPSIPRLTSIAPASGGQGESVIVTITGSGTSFVQGTTQVSFGPDTSIGNVAVSDSTQLTVQVVIAANAATGPRTPTVTTGSEVVSLPNGFSVTAAVALTRIDITPAPAATLVKGQTLQFSARGTFSNGSIQDPLVGVSWNSDVTSVATIGSSGLATGISSGVTNIHAALGAVQSSLSVLTVKPLPPTVSVPLSAGASTVNGVGAEPGASVQVLVNSVIRGPTTVADATGQWSVTGIAPALSTNNSVSAVQIVNGVASDPSAVVLVQPGTPTFGSTPTLSWNWRRQEPSGGRPSPRTGAASAQSYDAANNRLITVSGLRPTGQQALSDIWVLGQGPGFSETGRMNLPRWGHRATLLSNGTVLITGGWLPQGLATETAEIYDPATRSYTLTGNMSRARALHSATLLPNGTVLVVGGFDRNGFTGTAEVYNPSTGTFSPAASLNQARARHEAILLQNGNVLVAGGESPSLQRLTSAELYDPVANGFSLTGSMNVARYALSLLSLPSGDVLLYGGNSGQSSLVERYDAHSGTFAGAGNLTTARGGNAKGELLSNGSALFAGGQDPRDLESAEIYDPLTQTSSLVGNMGIVRVGPGIARLPSGKVLLSAGLINDLFSSPDSFVRSAETYDPASRVFSGVGSVATGRYNVTSTVLTTGEVLIAGGITGYDSPTESYTPTSASELFDERSVRSTWLQFFPPLPLGPEPRRTYTPARSGHVMAYAPAANRLIVQGGKDASNNILTDTWVVSNANGLSGAPAWSRLADSPVGLSNRAAAYDPTSNRLIVFGGATAAGTVDNSTWVLSNADGTASSSWSQLTPGGAGPSARQLHAVAYVPATNRLILFGGHNGAAALNDLWILNNANGLGGTAEWVQLNPVGQIPSSRFGHSIVYNATTNQLFLFGGREAAAAAFNDVWVLSNANGSGGTPAWTQLATTGSRPLMRSLAVVGVSPSADRLILALGDGLTPDLAQTASVKDVYLDDAWELANSVNARIGQTYMYQVRASDPDPLETLTFSLDLAPTGMTIDPATGFVQWSPTMNQLADHSVVVRVTNQSGRFATQSFRITVNIDNDPPVVNAGNAQTVSSGNAALGGTVSDDGYPYAGALTTRWTQVSGSGVTTFANANQAATTATFSAAGVYVLRLTSNDGELSSSDDVVITVTGTGATPALLSVTPNNSTQGQSFSVSVTGQNTHFVQGTSQLSLGPGVSVNSITVTCLTCLSAQVAIDDNAATGPRTAFVTTGSEVAALMDAFTVLPGTPVLSSLSPGSGQQGQSLSIGVTGRFTHFVQGTTQIDLGAGMTVTSVTVSSVTSLSAQVSIAAGATIGARTLTVTTGSEAVSLPNAFTVQAVANQPPVVNAGPDLNGALLSRVVLAATATDDGLPSGSLTVSWQKISGPGNITFENAALATTGAVVDRLGDYVLQVSATDGAFTVSDTLSLRITCPLSTSPGDPVAVCDEFQRPDGPVGNGWSTWWNATPSSSEIRLASGELRTLGAQNLAGGVYRTAPVSFPISFSLDFRTESTHFGCGFGSFNDGGWVLGFNLPVSSVPVNAGGFGPAQLYLIHFSGQRNIIRAYWDGTQMVQETVFEGPIGDLRDYQAATAANIEGAIAEDFSTTVRIRYNDGRLPEVVTVDLPALPNASRAPLGNVFELMNANCSSGPHYFDNIVVHGAGATGSPEILSVLPSTGMQGQQNLEVVITGRSTHFTQGITQIDLGAGITVANVAVTSPTSASALVSIASNAAIGPRTLTVTTGTEVASVSNIFGVTTAATLVRIDITPAGSVTLTKGQTFQFSARGTFSNNTVQDPLSGVTWISAPTNVASISTSGLATGVSAGNATIVATMAGIRSTATNFVVKPLPIALYGPINEGATIVDGAAAEPGATVQVMVNGLPRGPTPTANSTGTWSVTGLSPALVLGDSVTARQTVNGVTSDVSLPVVVTAGTPGLVSVSPATGSAGEQNLHLVISGQFTHFVQGVTQISFAGTAVTVKSLTVLSPTLVAANVSIAGNALSAPRTVTVTTGSEIVALLNAFTVQPGTNHEPTITIAPTWAVTLPNRLGVTYTVADDGLPFGGALTVDWSTVSGPGNVGYQNQTPTSISVGFDQPGLYTLRVTATDTQFTVSRDITVTVAGPVVSGSLIASITSPGDGAEITGPAAVVGNVSGPGLASWTLEVRGASETTFRTIATGTSVVTDSVLGTLDPTLLINGLTALQLRATDVGGQTVLFGPVNVVVSQNQKVGNFTVSFNDLTVPVAGLPIQIVRTYDSRDKRPGDFGIGWRLDLNAVTLNTNGALGDGWMGTSSGGLIPNLCITESRPHIVTITFSDGTVFQFQPTLNPACQQLVPLSQTSVSFIPVSTTPPNASLTIIGNADPFVAGNFPGPISLLDLDNVTILDPSLYRLTMPDGRVLVISAQAGLQSMTDLNGNSLTVTPAGVTHSSGKGVTFQRDGSNRITQITDPAGNAITYAYDAQGDLASVTDATSNVTTFTYNSSHGLLTIVDPRGVQPIRNVYDASGRLIQHVDAFGNTIDYTHDLNTRQEIVRDRLGNLTVNEYDDRGNVVRVTDARGGVTQRTYDARNNLLSETNPLNQTRTYTYDANNNRLTETDPLALTTTYTYNARNQVLTVRDPLGRVTTNTYDTSGNLTDTTDPLGRSTTYIYDSRGLRTSMTDAEGHTTAYEYDGSGNLTKQTDALGHVTTYTYDGNGNRLTESKTQATSTGSRTVLTQYEYDAQNRPARTIFPDGSTTRAVYNVIGKQESTIDQLGRQTDYTYDLMGRLTSMAFPDGTTESSTYDAEGRRLTSTDRAGRVTRYAYDALGRLTTTTFADNATTTTQYDAAGEGVVGTDARGKNTSYGYDSAGRRTSVTDALGHVTSFVYDAAGNQASLTDANGNTTQFQYDDNNRRVKTIYPDSTEDSVAYDALGRTTSKTDQAGRTTRFEYDALGRLTGVIDALSQRTSYTYDELGNRTSQTDANSHTTTFAYDAMGRRMRRTLPLGMFETFTYDAAGNAATKTDFNGRTTTYGYDSANRLTTKVPDPVLSEPTVQFSYNATGQRTQMVDASGTTTYTYDLRGRLISKATPQGALTYTYDTAGNLATIRSSNAGGTSVDYAYDSLNRLSTVTDNRLVSGVTTYAYDNVGNLASYQYPNGVTHSYTYNSLNRLTNLALGNSTTTLASYAYTLGLTGNRTQVAELGGRTLDYTYDALYRLNTEAITGAPGGTTTYAYDPVGNRLSRSSPTFGLTNYSYDANDRLTTDTYDFNGNTTTSGGNAYAYDFENHLTGQNSGNVSIVYDGDGNRVARTIGGITTLYLVDDRNLTGYAQVLEELSGGTVQRTYTYGLNRISQSQTSGTSFYGYDGNGNVRLLTDATGTVTDRYDYDAFGNMITHTGFTPNVYLYSGEQSDTNLGFYYLRARYYRPELARFSTMDPQLGVLDDPLSLHRYLYAREDPINRRDPSGRQYTLVDLSLSVTIQVSLRTVELSYYKNLLKFAASAGACIYCLIKPGEALKADAYDLIFEPDFSRDASDLYGDGEQLVQKGYSELAKAAARVYIGAFTDPIFKTLTFAMQSTRISIDRQLIPYQSLLSDPRFIMYEKGLISASQVTIAQEDVVIKIGKLKRLYDTAGRAGRVVQAFLDRKTGDECYSIWSLLIGFVP